MANKYSVDLSINTKGYKDGMDAAKQENEQFSSTVVDANKDLASLNKTLANAKREVNNLALAYARLDKDQKNTAEGEALKRQLDKAKEFAAELIDLKGDLNEELKHMASDTAMWDMGKEGIQVTRDTLTALATTIEDVTGKESGLGNMIKTVAKIQTIANAAITIGNALQKQSALMRGIASLQAKAQATAISLETAATKTNTAETVTNNVATKASTVAKEGEIVATKGATVAQKAFNAVAKANPYVLLAMAVLAVGTALVTFTVKANQAESATKRLNREMHAASIQGQKDAVDDTAKLDMLYKRATDVNASLNDRIKATQQLQRDYPAYLGNLSQEAIMAGDAADAYKQLRNDIIQAAVAKAYFDKITEKTKENIDIDDQIIEKEKEIDRLQQQRNSNNGGFTPGAYSPAATAGELWNLQAEIDNLEELKRQREENNEAIDRYNAAINGAADAINRLDENEVQRNNHQNGSGGSTNVDNAVTGSITELEKEINKLQQQLRDGLIPEQDIEKTLKQIDDLQRRVKDLKIRYGFEEPEKAKSKLQELEENLRKAQQEYIIAVDADEDEAKFAALEAYHIAQRELDKYKAKIKIEPEVDPADIEKQKANIQEIITDALTPQQGAKDKFNFDYLPDEFKPAANTLLEKMTRIEQAKKKLDEIVANSDPWSDQYVYATEVLQQLEEIYDALGEKTQVFQNLANAAKIVINKQQKLGEVTEKVGIAAEATGQLFGFLGEIGEDTDLKIASIIANAIANITLSFANAMKTTKSFTVWDWIAQAGAGLATLATMISQIKSMNSGYAGGGIIGSGTSMHDNTYARVAEGEMILNRHQQRNLFDAIDNGKLGGNQRVQVTGVIRGTDLLLVQKNTNKLLNKSGNAITF